MVIGERIHELRLKKELTQERLADYLCVSHQAISKWENGIAVPDIDILLSLSQLFEVSVDYLCGVGENGLHKISEDTMRNYPFENRRNFDDLMEGYAALSAKLNEYPFNQELLVYGLKYARRMHDTVTTDEQKDISNEAILSIAQRIFYISKNDYYRCLENYNLALYYDEHIKRVGDPPLHQKEIAARARHYADRVYYKDMHKTFYNMFGIENDNEMRVACEKTLKEMMAAVDSSVKNLSGVYKRQNRSSEMKVLNDFSEIFINAKKVLEQRFRWTFQ